MRSFLILEQHTNNHLMCIYVCLFITNLEFMRKDKKKRGGIEAEIDMMYMCSSSHEKSWMPETRQRRWLEHCRRYQIWQKPQQKQSMLMLQLALLKSFGYKANFVIIQSILRRSFSIVIHKVTHTSAIIRSNIQRQNT